MNCVADASALAMRTVHTPQNFVVRLWPFRLFREQLDIYPSRMYYPRMAKKNSGDTPLTPAVLHILLALSTTDRHGYGIMKQVESDSQGKVRMGPGTLYGSISRMIDAGLIGESDKRVDPEMDDERRILLKDHRSRP